GLLLLLPFLAPAGLRGVVGILVLLPGIVMGVVLVFAAQLPVLHLSAAALQHHAFGGQEGAEHVGAQLRALARANPGVRRGGVHVLLVVDGIVAPALVHVDEVVAV